jgi:subtilisin family serine protease
MSEWYVPAVMDKIVSFPDLKSTLADGDLARADAAVNTTDGDAPILYRRNVLLGRFADEFTDPDRVAAELDRALAAAGWTVTIVTTGDAAELTIATGDAAEAPDAWTALQLLRATPGLSATTQAIVDSLTLKRLSFVGMPAKEGHGAGIQREAVALPSPAPYRRPLGLLPGGRRPVVAILDTGIGRHRWLPDDPFDPVWQDAQQLGWVPRTPLRTPPPRGGGDTAPHDGTTDTHAGHGTFIAGLIRQAAPDARLLTMHVMNGDGVLEEDLVLDALQWLLKRVRAAADDPDRFVDVICLAFGYYEQVPADTAHTRELRSLLGDLGDLGVRVVASAGNHASDAPVHPASLTRLATPDSLPRTELICVGALNPDGSRASYSNHGDWVGVWAPGTALVSTLPEFDGKGDSAVPQPYQPGRLASGFARWAGTSFAAAVIAGQLAGALTAYAEHTHQALDVDPESAHRRALAARRAVIGR